MSLFFRRVDIEVYGRSAMETLFLSHFHVSGRDQIDSSENGVSCFDRGGDGIFFYLQQQQVIKEENKQK